MTDDAYLSQSCKTTGYSPRHVSLHGHVAVHKYSQIANRLCRLDWTTSPQTENGSLGTRCCWRFEAHQSTSVLSAFSCKRLDAIHLSTLLMHCCSVGKRLVAAKIKVCQHDIGPLRWQKNCSIFHFDVGSMGHFIFCWNQSLRPWSDTRRKSERLKTGFRPSSH